MMKMTGKILKKFVNWHSQFHSYTVSILLSYMTDMFIETRMMTLGFFQNEWVLLGVDDSESWRFGERIKEIAQGVIVKKNSKKLMIILCLFLYWQKLCITV